MEERGGRGGEIKGNKGMKRMTRLREMQGRRRMKWEGRKGEEKEERRKVEEEGTGKRIISTSALLIYERHSTTESQRKLHSLLQDSNSIFFASIIRLWSVTPFHTCFLTHSIFSPPSFLLLAGRRSRVNVYQVNPSTHSSYPKGEEEDATTTY